MTYGYVAEVSAPIEMYDALHAEVVRAGDGAAAGLLVHIGRPSPRGFQVVEVWESRSHFERFNDEIVLPALGLLTAGQQGPPPQQTIQEFEVRGLVLPGGQVIA